MDPGDVKAMKEYWEMSLASINNLHQRYVHHSHLCVLSPFLSTPPPSSCSLHHLNTLQAEHVIAALDKLILSQGMIPTTARWYIT